MLPWQQAPKGAGRVGMEPLEDSFLRVYPVLPLGWLPQGYGAERPPQYSIKARTEQRVLGVRG